ncbi:hypothetical protein T4A_4813 [Trichinella pseudospiralis]|uniref:Uncharacterized protein n=1 Tax=Trichinella pseudospiralis TaxID=6337 RepID=A0A0V1AJF5_TRIPS|nr:hypothetical protein T4A_4813 [Trichinella pseudospiralis]
MFILINYCVFQNFGERNLISREVCNQVNPE